MKVYEKEILPEITTSPFEKLEEWYAKEMEVKQQPFWIRFFDILLATVGVLFTFVPMLIVAITIKLDSRGSVFFIQERLGYYKRPIWLIKFRTMSIDAEKSGPTWAQENDPRVTFVGRILRKIRFDEIPQLFNVLRGDLSFVGPRPIRKYFADLLKQHNPTYDRRFLVKPGISGWAQIFAPYGSTIEEQLSKLPYDLKYLKGLSLKDYFVIILLTIRTILMGNGV
jgi:lipopolysaccharide/colanic/teichoic acid biosynthesis glycosyltransferase